MPASWALSPAAAGGDVPRSIIPDQRGRHERRGPYRPAERGQSPRLAGGDAAGRQVRASVRLVRVPALVAQWTRLSKAGVAGSIPQGTTTTFAVIRRLLRHLAVARKCVHQITGRNRAPGKMLIAGFERKARHGCGSHCVAAIRRELGERRTSGRVTDIVENVIPLATACGSGAASSLPEQVRESGPAQAPRGQRTRVRRHCDCGGDNPTTASNAIAAVAARPAPYAPAK